MLLMNCCDGCLQNQVWVLLSAILWLGNIEFDPAGDDSVTVRRDEALANAAELLNLDEDELATALTERMLTAGTLLLPTCWQHVWPATCSSIDCRLACSSNMYQFCSSPSTSIMCKILKPLHQSNPIYSRLCHVRWSGRCSAEHWR